MVDAAIIGGLFTNLEPLIKDELYLLKNFKREVKRISDIQTSIGAVLEDAERKQEKDKQTEDWLRKLKRVAYEVRDIVDELTLEDLRLQVKRRNASSSTWVQVTNSCFSLPLCNIWTRLKIGHKIKDIQEKLDHISFVRDKLQLRESNPEPKSTIWRQTISKLSEKVYGRNDEEEKIVNILIHSSNDATELSILPIHGIGGLGKTTLAQLVFNNEEVTKHFDPKIWVCVSEEFDIKLIIKAIIGATDETVLERLHNKISNKLKGKRYLLVLDDVWNDNVEQWNVLKSILNCGSNGAFILTTTRTKRVAEIMKTIKPFNLSPISEDDCWQLLEERAFQYETPKAANFIGIGKEIATKCKGVPLVAKTLGSQLGFKNDEKEWCRIRDSEMWEISKYEESILPILRLSYYDLPYDLRRCFAFCAIFPKDTEIEKERLIQLWMAHDFIPLNKNQELEDNGNIIWDELCWRSFFQEDKLDRDGVQTCKMHDLMHDLAQFVMKDECYTMDDKSSGKDFEREIRHLTIMVDECKELSFASLKNRGGLQSIILHSNRKEMNEKVSKEIFSAVKEFSSLRVFDGCSDMQSIGLHYLGCLKHLRCLNLSSNKMMETLPDSICDLLNLQTLNLNYCSNLESLPRNTKDLINLRHLHLEGCDKLKYMPRGMGQLRNLKKLSLFVIRKESDGELDELRELDIRGSLKILNLESVSDASIARGISMSKMSSVNKLALFWNDDTNINGQKMTRHEKIDEALEVPTIYLKILRISGYNCVNIPKWVGESSATLRDLRLEKMDNVQHIFTMNNMNTSCESRMPMPFPLLEELRIKDMKNLRELVSPPSSTPIPITTTGAFPNLSELNISNCPKLGALPPHFKSLKDVSIEGKCSDELLDCILNLSGLINLKLQLGSSDISVLVGAANTSSDDVVLLPLLEYLLIEDMKNLRELVSPPPSTPIPITTTGPFPNLQMIEIANCPKLGALPPHLKSLEYVWIEGDSSDELLHSISNLSGLKNLILYNMDERSVLFGGGNYNYEELTLISSSLADNSELAQGGGSTFQSLRQLEIRYCSKLRCLFDEECEEELAAAATRGGGERERTRSVLTNLDSLDIRDCPELMISVEQWRNLLTHSLLEYLEIRNCPKLVPSKVEEAAEVIALLRSLRPRLNRWRFDVDFLPEEAEEEES